jgi:tetratricopeptide (TPR) repeat protein
LNILPIVKNFLFFLSKATIYLNIYEEDKGLRPEGCSMIGRNVLITMLMLALLTATPAPGMAKRKDAYLPLLKAGEFYINTRQYDRAIDNFKKCIELNSLSDEAYKNLGYSYYKKKEYQKAIDSYKQALSLNADAKNVRYRLAMAYKATGNIDDAVIQLENAIDQNPRDAESIFELGVIYGQKKLYSQAIEMFEKVIAINPNYSKAYYNLGVAYYAKKDFNKSQEYYIKAIEANKNNANAHKNLAAIYVDRKQYVDAINHLKAYVNSAPGASDVDFVEFQIKKLRSIIGDKYTLQ